MAGFVGTPPIITEGLVFALDVGSYKCITGSTNDISNGVITIINEYLCEGANGSPGTGTHTPNPAYMPSYSSDYGGILDFSGGRGMNVVQNLGTSTVSTYSIWVLWDSGDYSNQYFFDARSDGGIWHFSNYNGNNINWNQNLTYNFGGGSYISTDWPSDEWVHIITVSDSSGSKIYVNGSNRTSDASSKISTDEDLGKNFRIGTRYTTSQPYKGKMGPIHLYKQAFDDQEALQMFNTYKSRFNALPYDELALKQGW
jgi:hypothetical protein